MNILDIHWLAIVTARATIFNDLGFFFKGLFLTDSLIGYMLTLLFTSVLVKAKDIHRAANASTPVNNYSLFTFWHSCVTVRALFFRYKAFVTILEHLKLKFSISIH